MSFHLIGDIPIEENELVNALPTIRQICLFERTWDIAESSEGRILVEWDDDKWMFRDVFDFSCPEAYWLCTHYYMGPPHDDENDGIGPILV